MRAASWLIAIAAAAAVSLAARAVGALTARGAAAATVVGAVTLACGGLAHAAVLVLFFATASGLSALAGRRARERRGARQVLANGGAATIALLFRGHHPLADLAFLAAIAVATADTWATEVGERFGGTPRSIVGFRRVVPSTSGGVSVVGTIAAIAGAATIALAGLRLIPGIVPREAGIAAAAGLLGAFVDSALGATLEERRACPACGAPTAGKWHDGCTPPTQRISGVPGLNNDAVNLLATIAGALVAIALRGLGL